MIKIETTTRIYARCRSCGIEIVASPTYDLKTPDVLDGFEFYGWHQYKPGLFICGDCYRYEVEDEE